MRASGLSDTSIAVKSQSLTVVGYTYHVQLDQVSQLSSNITGIVNVPAWLIGLAGENTLPSVYTDLMDVRSYFDPLRSASVSDSAVTQLESSASIVGLEIASILESTVVEQVQGQPSVSSDRLFRIAATASATTTPGAGQFVDLTNAGSDSNNASLLSTSLKNYSQTDIGTIKAALNANKRVFAPVAGNLSLNKWSGAGYFIYDPSLSVGSALISGKLNGGSSTTLGSIVVSVAQAIAQDVLNIFSSGTVGNPINLSTGDFYQGADDLVIGNKPFALPFHRSYNSANQYSKGSLGWGWTHNWIVTLKPNSDGLQSMGQGTPVDAAATAVSIWIAFDLLNTPATSLNQFVASALTASWMSDGWKKNTMLLSDAGSVRKFTKLPDGTWSPPKGETFELRSGTTSPYTVQFPQAPASGLLWYVKMPTGEVRAFSDASGNLVAIADPNANKTSLAYDSNGRLLTVTNAATRKLTLSYNADSTISSVTDGQSRTASYVYSGGSLIKETSPTAASTIYTYDNPGRMISYYNPSLPGTPFVVNYYDGVNHVYAQADAQNNLSWFYFSRGYRTIAYDQNNNWTETWFTSSGKPEVGVEFEGNGQYAWTNYYFDGLGRLIKTVFPEHNATTVTYDTANNPITVVRQPKSGSALAPIITSAIYDPTWNAPLSTTDANGNTTTYTLDSHGNVTKITQPTIASGQPVTTFTYTTTGLLGLVAQSTDPATQGITTYTYNTLGQITKKAIDPTGINIVTSYTYNTYGDLATVTDPLSHVTTTVYDKARRPTKITQPLSVVTNIVYDADGRVVDTQKTDSVQPDGFFHETATYTPTGKTATFTTNTGNTTTFTYDVADRLTQSTNAIGKSKSYGYDFRNRLVSITDELGKTSAKAYDKNSVQTSYTDARGNRTAYVLDDFERLAGLDYPDGQGVRYTLDANGNRLNEASTGAAGVLRSWSYDALNHPVYQSAPGQNFLIAYNKNGTLAGYGDASDSSHYAGGQSSIGYDKAGRKVLVQERLVSFVPPSAPSAATIQTPGAVANPAWRLEPGGHTLAYTLDKAGNVVQTDIKRDSTLLFTVKRKYDSLNRLTEIDDGSGTSIVTFTYDERSRFTQVTHHNTATRLDIYNMDSNDNEWNTTTRLPGPDGLESVVQFYWEGYDALDRHTSMILEADANLALYRWRPTASQALSYQYDAGNALVSINNGPAFTYSETGDLASDGINIYGHDTAHHMTGAITPQNWATYAFDALGQRQSKVVNGTTTYFGHDGQHEVAEYDASGNVLRLYVYGPGTDYLVAMLTPGANGTWSRSYVHADARNTVFAVTNDQNQITERYGYGPFGETPITTGIPFRYTGRRLDPETGLYFYRARMYSPRLGRFLEKDPIGYEGGTNLFAYVGSDPINFVDPSGLCAKAVGSYLSTSASSLSRAPGDIAGYARTQSPNPVIFCKHRLRGSLG